MHACIHTYIHNKYVAWKSSNCIFRLFSNVPMQLTITETPQMSLKYICVCILAICLWGKHSDACTELPSQSAVLWRDHSACVPIHFSLGTSADTNQRGCYRAVRGAHLDTHASNSRLWCICWIWHQYLQVSRSKDVAFILLLLSSYRLFLISLGTKTLDMCLLQLTLLYRARIYPALRASISVLKLCISLWANTEIRNSI